MNINKNFNDVTIFNGKKIILIGPTTKDVNKLNLETYDFVFLFGFYINHIEELINLKEKYHFSLCRVLGGYNKEDQEKYVLPFDNDIDYYCLAEVHTVNEYIKENIIDKNKLFSMNNNYKSFGWTTEGKYPTGLPKLLLFFHVNNIKHKELFISGFTFYLNIDNSLCYEESCWLEALESSYEELKDKDINSLDDKLKLYLELYEGHLKGTLSIKEQQDKYLDFCWNKRTDLTPHCNKLDYNFFLKYLSMYGNFVKLDKKLKKIVKKYNKLFDV